MAFNDPIPSTNPRKPRAGLIVGIAIISALIISMFSFNLMFHRSNITGSVKVPPPNGIKVKLRPSTFQVESRQTFQLQALSDFDRTCERIEATIPDENWKQTFTPAELLKGTQASWNPSRTGTFRMAFYCEGRYLGDTGVSVVIKPSVVALKKEPKFRWVLSYGKPIYRETSFFEIPIMVSSEEQRGSGFLPSVVNRDVSLILRERNGQLSGLAPIIIPRNTGNSDPIYLPFPVGADYRLIAYEKEQGQASNELAVLWAAIGPKLSLIAFPNSVDLYSANISSASVRLYLALDNREIRPSQTLQVIYQTPPVFKSEPPAAVDLTPTAPIGTYTLSSATTTGGWSVNFQQPAIGLTTSANIQVLSVRRFCIAAILAGLLGVIVARQRRLFNQHPLLVLLELICAGAAAFLLYGMILAGMIPVPGSKEFMFGYLAAILVGLVGGYAGLGVFQLAKKILVH